MQSCDEDGRIEKMISTAKMHSTSTLQGTPHSMPATVPPQFQPSIIYTFLSFLLTEKPSNFIMCTSTILFTVCGINLLKTVQFN